MTDDTPQHPIIETANKWSDKVTTEQDARRDLNFIGGDPRYSNGWERGMLECIYDLGYASADIFKTERAAIDAAEAAIVANEAISGVMLEMLDDLDVAIAGCGIYQIDLDIQKNLLIKIREWRNAVERAK